MKRTPLYDTHVSLGAKMVPFAGFEMPVSYPEGISAEHKSRAGKRRRVRRIGTWGSSRLADQIATRSYSA